VEIRTLDIDLAKNLFRVHCRCQGKDDRAAPHFGADSCCRLWRKPPPVWWEWKPAVEHTIGRSRSQRWGRSKH
jgi:hypothetical protein